MTRLEQIAVQALAGILANPNYNFNGAKKVALQALEHAQALIEKLPSDVPVGTKVVDAPLMSKVAIPAKATKDPLAV
jgi:hypothetical protein